MENYLKNEELGVYIKDKGQQGSLWVNTSFGGCISLVDTVPDMVELTPCTKAEFYGKLVGMLSLIDQHCNG